MAVKARKGNTMNEEFITLLKRVKAIQETPASELTEQDKAMIEGRIIVQENYEKNLMRKNNLETIMEEYKKYCKEYADIIRTQETKRYLADKSYNDIAAYYWKNYPDQCIRKMTSDILQWLDETRIDEFPKPEPLPDSANIEDFTEEEARALNAQKKYYSLLFYGYTKSAAEHFLYLKISDFRNALFILPEQEKLPDTEREEAEKAHDKINEKIVEIINQWATEWERQGILEEKELNNALQEMKTHFRDFTDSHEIADNTLEEIVISDKISVNKPHGKGNLPIPNANTIFPNEYLKSIDKVTKNVFDCSKNAYLYDDDFPIIGMEKKGAKREINTYVKLALEEKLEGVEMPVLSSFESSVHDAIMTLYEAGNSVISLQMIYNAMVGKKAQKISNANVQRLQDAVTKLLYTGIKIDASAEKDSGYLGKNPKIVTYDGHLLAGERITSKVKLNGHIMPEQTCIKIFRRPVLLDYAEQKQQIIRGPIGDLDVPFSKTVNTIPLRDYLVKRVKEKKNPVVILYDTLYKSQNIPATDRKRKKIIRDNTMEALDYWMQDRGTNINSQIQIKNYEIYDKTGKIILPSNRKSRSTKQPYKIVIHKSI